MARRHKRFPKTKDKPLPIKEWLNGRGNNRKKKPETSTRYYAKEEVEFMMGMSALKKKLGRMPTPGEILAKAREMGYVLHKPIDRDNHGSANQSEDQAGSGSGASRS